MRNFNRSRYGRMEEDCRCIFKGDMVDKRWCELHLHEVELEDAGDLHAGAFCAKRQRIVEYSDSVAEMAEDLKRHEAECPVCGDSGEVELRRAA